MPLIKCMHAQGLLLTVQCVNASDCLQFAILVIIPASHNLYFLTGFNISDALALRCSEDTRDGMLQTVWLSNEERIALGQENGGIDFFQAGERKVVDGPRYPE